MLVCVFVRAPRLPTSVGLLGPAFIAAVAYVDPGNVATNVTAGATFGYALVWVVVDRKSTRLNSSHVQPSRMPSSA